KMICQRLGERETFEIDARTSDAVALAVRFKAPIYTYEFILGSAGIILDDEDEKDVDSDDMELDEIEHALDESTETLSTKELEEKLMTAIESEDYEAASRIRDEISKRKKKS